MSVGAAAQVEGQRLLSTFSEVLVRLAGERPGMLLVTGPDPAPVTAFLDIWPERLITVPPGLTRLAVGEGVRLGGGESVVVLDEQFAGILSPPTVPVLLLTTDPQHLSLAFRHGLTACQPAQPDDVPPLLVGALGADGPVVLHLPPEIPGPPLRDVERCTFGEPRVVHRGRHGLVVGAGRTGRIVQQVARALTSARLAVTALEAHTLPADSGVDAALTHGHLLAGPPDAPRAGALTPVPVDFDDLVATAESVRAVLRP